MNLLLKIKLLTDACPGSGMGYAGVIDRDFLADEFGLPYIQGRRLKGLLRDAYVEVKEHRNNGPSIDEIFGIATSPGRVDVDDARLAGNARMRTWLKAMGGTRPTVYRHDVSEAFSGLRRQTAIDRATGAARKNSLRVTRVLTKGLEFQALIQVPEKYRDAIADSARALKLMGASRTRGLGRVSCTVAEAMPEPSIHGTAEVIRGRLHYRLKLRRAAIFPQAASDPNTIASRDYVPGAAILGLFASAWGDKDSEFMRIFFGGETRFLNAYPVIDDARSIAVPAAIRQIKGREDYVNFAKAWGEEQVRRVGGWCQGSVLSGTTSEKTSVAIDFHYHHQRSDDRRIGRAIGSEKKSPEHLGASEGAFFAYEAVEAGQKFEGAILGKEEDLKKLAAAINSKANLTVGRSRASGYGGNVKLQWLSLREAGGLDHGGRELIGWRSRYENEEDVKEFVVTLLSPVSWFNDDGHPCAVFPLEQLREKLNTSLKIEKHIVRTRLYGGFLAHQCLPKQQFPCLDTGSTFLVTSETLIKLSDLRKAEDLSYGARIEEGFGRIAIDPVNLNSYANLEEAQLPPAGSAVLENKEDSAYELAKRIFECALKRQAVEIARQVAVEHAKGPQIPPSQLARLLQIVEQNLDPSKASAKLKDLKEISRKKLGRALDEVQRVVKDVSKEYTSIHDGVFNGARWKWNLVFQNTGSPFIAQRNDIVQLYLCTYLRVLIEKNRGRD